MRLRWWLPMTVSTFCTEQGISCKSFYELRKRARVEGPAAVLEPKSRRPGSSPPTLTDKVKDAIAVVDKAVAAHGVPQRLLSDNGAALNPSRRGLVGRLVAHIAALGTEAITGKPYKPTTQGKNERFHQTLFRYLDKQPLAATLTQLQAQVDAFDHVYNTQRPHQGLPGRITPLAA